MKRIESPYSNINDPDEVVAQSIAADGDWMQDDQGAIYDTHGVFLTKSMVDLGFVMRSLDWFVPADAEASGPYWRRIPVESDERADAIRVAARVLGR